MGIAHQKRQRLTRRTPFQDDEEKRESKDSADALPCLPGRVTQLTNMRATAKQRGCDRERDSGPLRTRLLTKLIQ